MALGVVLKALGVLLECSWSGQKGPPPPRRDQGEVRGRSGSSPGRGRVGLYAKEQKGGRGERIEGRTKIRRAFGPGRVRSCIAECVVLWLTNNL